MALPDVPNGQGRFQRWQPVLLSGGESSVTPISGPVLPEQLVATEKELQRHRRIVSEGALGFLNKWDRFVADRIGYEGNIRQTILTHRQLLRNGFAINGLDHFPNDRTFFVGADVLKESPLGSYTIDFEDENFHHSLLLRGQRGYLLVEMSSGSTEKDSSRIHISESARNMQGLTTFIPHLRREGPDHPLRTEPSERTEVYYEGIDRLGNTTLTTFNGTSSGNYSSSDGLVKFSGASHLTGDGGLEFIDLNGKPCIVPLRTNIYDEIRKFIPDFPVLTQ